MGKTITTIFAVLLVVSAIVFVTRQQYQCSKRGHNQNAQNTQQRSQPSPSVGTSVVHNDRTEENAQKRESGAPRWNKFFTWPDGIATWAIILTCAVIAWQAWETRKAATAALLNAQAVIKAERPWLIVSVTRTAPYIFEFAVKNIGRTPAVILSVQNTIKVVESKMPIPPEYPPELMCDALLRFLAPGDSHWLIQKSVNMTEWLKGKIRPGRAPVYAFGTIVYRDVFRSEQYETRWCRWYSHTQDGDFLPDECPEGYNGYT